MLKLSGYLTKPNVAFLFALLALPYSGVSYADPTPQIKDMRLNNVTVFLRGAELFNSAQVTLPAGESEVIFTNIASDINEKTILLGTDSKALIKSSVVRRDYLDTKTNSPEIDRLESQIEELQNDRIQLQIEQQVIDAQLKMLQENSRLNNDSTSVTVDDISDMWDFLANEMKDALRDQARLNKSLTELDKQLSSLRRQIQELQTKGTVVGNQLAVKFYSEEPVNTNVNLSYAIPSAGWTPVYDVSVDNVNGPVNFTYKAEIAQASGINWNNVHLKLSTGNLSRSTQAPVIQPNYVDLYEAPKNVGGVYYEMAVPAEDMAYAKRGKASSINDYVTTSVNGISTTFDISLPYSIPSDAKQHLVAIKQEQAKGDYRYYVVPKLDNSAFLQVQIADWQTLNLLPGKSNVFFEGSFIGEGHINTNDIQDNVMNISLGRDDKIIVNRDSVLEMRGKPEFFGNNVNQSYGYAIDVINTRNETVKLVIADQVPVSRDARVTITDVKYDKGAQWNKDTGEIQWTLTMLANTTQKLSLAYTVRYPKDKEVTGL